MGDLFSFQKFSKTNVFSGSVDEGLPLTALFMQELTSRNVMRLAVLCEDPSDARLPLFGSNS